MRSQVDTLSELITSAPRWETHLSSKFEGSCEDISLKTTYVNFIWLDRLPSVKV